jgi:hypothetical protein
MPCTSPTGGAGGLSSAFAAEHAKATASDQPMMQRRRGVYVLRLQLSSRFKSSAIRYNLVPPSHRKDIIASLI